MTLDKTLPTRGPRPSSPTTRKPAQDTRSVSPTMEETLEARKLWCHSWWNQVYRCRLDPALGPAVPWPLCALANQYNLGIPQAMHNCFRNEDTPLHSQLPQNLSGYMSPAARLQEPALPTSTPALTSGPSFTWQWVGNNSRIRTSYLPASQNYIQHPCLGFSLPYMTRPH